MFQLAPLLHRRPAMSALALSLLLIASAIPYHARATSVPVQTPNLVPNDVELTRLKIYEDVLHKLAMHNLKKSLPGKIATLESPPFSNMTFQVIILDRAFLVAKGYKLREFTLPPGLTIDTKSPQIALLYNTIPNDTAPFKPADDGVEFMPYFTGLEIVAYPPTAAAAAGGANGQALKVIAPKGSPITVTFPAPVTDPAFPPRCTAFTAAGFPAYLTMTEEAATNTITCESSTLAEFTLAAGPSVPPVPLPPTPPPTAPPSSPPVVPPVVPSIPPPTPEKPPTPPPSAPVPATSTASPANSTTDTSSSTSAASGTSTPSTTTDSSSGSSGTSAAVYIAIVFGVLILIALAGLLVWFWRRAKKQKQLEEMALAAEKSASLETALIGTSRTPAAGSLRTKAMLENETF